MEAQYFTSFNLTNSGNTKLTFQISNKNVPKDLFDKSIDFEYTAITGHQYSFILG